MVSQILQWDLSLFWQINSAHHPALDIFFRIFTNLGNIWVILPLFLALLLFKVPPARRRPVVIFTLAGLIVCGATNSIIKYTVRRYRPVKHFARYDPEKKNDVHVVGKRLKFRSFPSGHTNTAFAAATLVVLLWGARFWFAYILALLVAYSRVYMGVHFPLDTVIGALLGTVLMGAVMTAYKKKLININ